jgi:preprotein translocase subunit SecD
MYQFPKWKYWLVIGVLVAGLIFFVPNLFPQEPALQVVRKDRQEMDAAAELRVQAALEAKALRPSGSYFKDGRLILKFGDKDQRQQARDVVVEGLGSKEFSVALSDVQGGPDILRKIGLKPMSLGLDLRGGVQLVYEVDVRSSINQALERMEREFRTILREQRIPFANIATANDTVRIGLRDASDTKKAEAAIKKLDASLQVEANDGTITVKLTPDQLTQRQTMAIQQNILTLRKRVDELGVSEPIVTQQGLDRIVVQLPGMDDPNEAIRILGTAASVEFRLTDETNDPYEAERTKRVPISSKLYKLRGTGQPILVKRELIATGDQLTDANSSFADGRPAVNVKLDGRAGAEMLKTTQQNMGHRMSVVYIQKKQLSEGEICDGVRVGSDCTEEDVISDARINGVFSNSFQITGLAVNEANDLALLLRAGSLATPLKLIGQRTVGPSLGQDNIERGMWALVVGLLLTFVFMAIYYRAFGWVANAVLLSNLILTVGLLSMIQASLSLPGIAAVVFHLGIAVDANILIYERIREELRLGNSPQAAINAGFEKAFATIADSNVTTLIAGVVLMALGSGTILSFAIVMTLGILTSLFTSVVGSRALVHFVWGRRKQIDRLSI